MNKVLKNLPFAVIYLDDIIIFSKTAKDHLGHLKQGYHKLRNTNLSMNLSKCHFFAKEIQSLGHIPSATGIKCLPPKTEPIKIMWLPRNAKQEWTSLGLIGYYGKFIKDFTHIAKPLMTLM